MDSPKEGSEEERSTWYQLSGMLKLEGSYPSVPAKYRFDLDLVVTLPLSGFSRQ